MVKRDPQNRILAGALQVFAQKGLKGARTREIARLARVNIAAIHYYYGSKEELYDRVVQPLFTIIFRRLKKAATSSDDPCECLEAVVDTYFDFLKEHSDLPRLMMWEMVTEGSELQRILKPILLGKGASGVPERLIGLFRKGQERGIFKPHDPVQATISLIALCVFPFFARKMLDMALPNFVMAPEFVEQRRRHVKDLLGSGLSPDRRDAQ